MVTQSCATCEDLPDLIVFPRQLRPESDMADVIQPDAITGRLVEGMWLEKKTVEPMPDHPVATVLTKALCSSL